MTESHPDIRLAQRAAEGDDAAWREIYTSTREKLFALVYYHVGEREEALDVLQETYRSAVRGIGGYRGDGSLESWLCGIALRRSRDWKRRFLKVIRRTVPLDLEVENLQDRPGVDPEEARALKRALATLTSRQRGAFLLHEWIGYSFAEIAPMIRVSEATARVHCHRAKEKMKRLLKTAPATPSPRREAQGS